jgi:hypothetical protein
MGQFDKLFFTRADGIIGPATHPEVKEQSIKVDKGKLGQFGVNWEPVTRAFQMVKEPHKHEYGQILAFISSNMYDLFDFDAEIHLWLEGEKHIITETTIINVPGGMVHCPLHIVRVGKPFLFNNMYFTAEYKSIKVQP